MIVLLKYQHIFSLFRIVIFNMLLYRYTCKDLPLPNKQTNKNPFSMPLNFIGERKTVNRGKHLLAPMLYKQYPLTLSSY